MPGTKQVRDSVLQAIGNTPVVRLRKVVSQSMGEVLVKLEYYNPTGSYKDRMALAMIEGAEAVKKSYPDFYDDLKKLGADVSLSSKIKFNE